MYKRFVKRALDIVISLVGLVVAFVPMLVVAVIVKLDTPGPVFFRQRRIGLHKKEFTIIKFRTMRTDAPHEAATRDLDLDAVRFTKAQLFLRSFSLDELPQLFNILRGHMSIIGPRPVLASETELIAERDKYGANDILPGLTGWAQINGRDELTLAEKARYDGEYVERVNFLMDCKCFFLTIWCVLRRYGVVEGDGTAVEAKEKEVVNQ